MIRPIRYTEILEATDLLTEYAAECSIPEIGETCPQPEIYDALEKAGIVQMFGAFGGEKLVGFGSMLTTVLPHYGKKVATVESLFLAKNYRAGGLGLALMDAMEQAASASGCAAILYSAPTGGKLETLLSMRREYRQTNTVFCRKLN